MVPDGPGVSLPHLGVPARIPSSSAEASLPTPARCLPPIASAPFPPLPAGGPAQPPRHSRPGAPGGGKDAGRLPAMAWQGDTPLGAREQTSPGMTLTGSLIAARSLPLLADPLHPRSRSTELPSSSSSVCLDQEDIGAIGRLQSLREIRSLYLQQNKIKKMENLGCSPNLRFLSLAGNHIRRVENLLPLRHLRVLDLSHNQIQALDPDELPRSLRHLDLTGNECTHQHGYRELVVGALPHLLELDAQQVCGNLGEEEEEESSPSSEDEDAELLSELSGPFTTGRADFFVDLHQELAGRSRWRRREALDDHQTRLEELAELREHRDLLLPPAPLSPGREGAACPTVPDPSGPHPQKKPGLQLPPLPGPGEQPQRAPGRSQPQSKAPEEKTRPKGARNRQFPQTPQAGMAPQSSD